MALHVLSLGTNQQAGSNPQSAGFFCVQVSPGTSAADLASADLAIVDDQKIRSYLLAVPNATVLQPGIFIAATTTTASPTVSTITFSSPAGVGFSNIPVGSYLVGPGIPAGTYVSAVGATTLTMNQNAIQGYIGATFVVIAGSSTGGYAGTGGVSTAFLDLPNNRGRILIRPGDVVAWDIFGWPFLIPSTSIGTVGTSPWVFT